MPPSSRIAHRPDSPAGSRCHIYLAPAGLYACDLQHHNVASVIPPHFTRSEFVPFALPLHFVGRGLWRRYDASLGGDGSASRRSDVTILDVFGSAASLRLDMHDWIGYMPMSKIDGRWVTINVLWELTPEAKKRRGFPEGM